MRQNTTLKERVNTVTSTYLDACYPFYKFLNLSLHRECIIFSRITHISG